MATSFSISTILRTVKTAYCFPFRVIRNYQSSKTGFSGVWLQSPDQSNDGIIKRDKVYLLHTDKLLEGMIEREYPIDIETKKWKFFGRVQDNFLYGFFHGISGNNVDSHGLIELYYNSESPYVYTGCYRKIIKQSVRAGEIKLEQRKINLHWERIGSLPWSKRLKIILSGSLIH